MGNLVGAVVPTKIEGAFKLNDDYALRNRFFPFIDIKYFLDNYSFDSSEENYIEISIKENAIKNPNDETILYFMLDNEFGKRVYDVLISLNMGMRESFEKCINEKLTYLSITDQEFNSLIDYFKELMKSHAKSLKKIRDRELKKNEEELEIKEKEQPKINADEEISDKKKKKEEEKEEEGEEED